ncbi:hypothetical protein GLAREA_04345 [Glarea lozoyensis ATCC 20868]|uniref:Uncharacterized protein n=1 Tax=Glarea lozoyensis (strain ATCC 20868 / MF5171) TaxID=1116229 RepID=S3CR15_GLAL2|nr:uncharacterized protein GLAREA_04345 [Glarea lozoyensis ATCC 20868]EPE27554.1 hypothetical protein GLAREA_04345 [Glarea lozoyensis ATCC 20868]
MVDDEQQLDDMLNNPQGDLWRDPEMVTKLKSRLPKCHALYFQTVDDMVETLQNLHDILGLGRVGFQQRLLETEVLVAKSESTAPTTALAVIKGIVEKLSRNFDSQAQRIRLASGKTERKELFEEFGAHTARLEKLLRSSDRLKTWKGYRDKQLIGLDIGLWDSWKQAYALSRLLAKVWQCKCRTYHHANLLLEYRRVPTANFKILFLFGNQLELYRNSWVWQATSFGLLPKRVYTSQGSNPVVSMSNEQRTSDPILCRPTELPEGPLKKKGCNKGDEESFSQPIFESRPRKRFTSLWKSRNTPVFVKIGHLVEDNVTFTEQSEITQIPIQTVPAQLINSTDSNIITNLCAKISNCSAELLPYGVLEETDIKCTIDPLCMPEHEPQIAISLGDLLGPAAQIILSQKQ